MTEYYDEDIFISKNNTNKYKCIHCKKVPKQFYRCKCTSQVPREDIGKGKSRYVDNTGLSCSNCTSRLCTSCKKRDMYEPDKHTSDNIRKLKVVCENNCGETISLAERENGSHVKNKCPKREHNCMYCWAGCMEEGAGEEIAEHEKEPQGHVNPAIEQLHRENERLRNETLELKARLDKMEDILKK